MSHNVHGHALPEPFRVNEDNPVFQRHQPEHVPAEIPLGQHGAVMLRSENESPVEVVEPEPVIEPEPEPSVEDQPLEEDETDTPIIPTDPASVESVEEAKKADGRRKKKGSASTLDPIPDHEDEPENLPEQPEVDTGATDPEFGEDREEEAAQDS